MTEKRHDAAEVTTADIHATKLYLQGVGPWRFDEIGVGESDPLVQAFARHRQASEARLLARMVEADDEMIEAGFNECCGTWPDEQCREFLPEIWKAMFTAIAAKLKEQRT